MPRKTLAQESTSHLSGSKVTSSSGVAHHLQSNEDGTLGSGSQWIEGKRSTVAVGRARSSSIVSVQEIKENEDGLADQAVMSNWNADWVNYKGAWLIHLFLLIIGKILLSVIPLMSQDVSWTTLNLGYLVTCFTMFHWVTGVPFEGDHSGAFDRLTLWEQIDSGAQYTPSKKMLTSIPILVFLLSTHYIRQDTTGILFSINFGSLILLALLPKLPQFHRIRFRFEGFGSWFSASKPTKDVSQSHSRRGSTISDLDEPSGPPTPVEMMMKGFGRHGTPATHQLVGGIVEESDESSSHEGSGR